MSIPPTRLLVVAPSLSEGGAERFASTLLQGLDRGKFTAAVCLTRANISYPLPGDVPVFSLDKQRPWHIGRAVRRLRRCIEEWRPDIVLSTIGSCNRFTWGALRGLSHRPRWVMRVASHPAREGFVGRQVDRRACHLADCIVANSRGLAAGVEQVHPVAAHRLRAIYNPANFAAMDRTADGAAGIPNRSEIPVIIAVGRLHPHKRPDLMIEAFDRLRRNMTVQLWICGDGPLRGPVEEDIARRGLGQDVRLLGFCQSPYQWMRQANVFLLGSDCEGLPNALIEAQGLGLPAVATRCPFGPDEIIDADRTGLLVPCGDAPAMARALEQILRDKQLQASMSRAASIRARHLFSAETIIEQWEDVLQNVRQPSHRPLRHCA